MFDFKKYLVSEILAKSNSSYVSTINQVNDFIKTKDGQEYFKKWLALQPKLKEKYNPVKHISKVLKKTVDTHKIFKEDNYN